MRKSTRLAAALTVSVLALGGATTAATAATPAERLESRSATSAQVAEGLRATDATRVIRVGAPTTVVPITVITEPGVGQVDAGIYGGRDDDYVGYGFAPEAEPGRPTVFKPTTEVYAEDITGWGAHTWELYGYVDEDDLDGFLLGEVPTDVRAHSLLGLSAARSGSQVAVRGSARAYHNVLDRYVAWSGRPVSVQRWTGSAWVQVGAVTTDARGNLATTVSVPAGSQLRLVTRDVAGTWGAVSATATA